MYACTVKPKFIQTPSTFLTLKRYSLTQFIHYSLENMTRTLDSIHVSNE